MSQRAGGPGESQIEGPCCAICDSPITSPDGLAQCWSDPGGNPCAAHFECLRRIGEFELDIDA